MDAVARLTLRWEVPTFRETDIPPMSRNLFALVVLIVTAGPLWADVDYDADVKPIFEEKCGSCHGVLRQEAGIRLDAGSLIRGDGEPSGLLDLDDPAASLLIRRVTSTDTDERMPPPGDGTPLSPDQIQKLISWIESGRRPARPTKSSLIRPPGTGPINDPSSQHL